MTFLELQNNKPGNIVLVDESGFDIACFGFKEIFFVDYKFSKLKYPLSPKEFNEKYNQILKLLNKENKCSIGGRQYLLENVSLIICSNKYVSDSIKKNNCNMIFIDYEDLLNSFDKWIAPISGYFSSKRDTN